MNTETGLIVNILSNLDDDLPRLVYADCIEELATSVKCFWCDGRGHYWIDPNDQLFKTGLMQSRYLVPNHPKTGHPLAEVKCKECDGTKWIPDGRRERARIIREQCADRDTLYPANKMTAEERGFTAHDMNLSYMYFRRGFPYRITSSAVDWFSHRCPYGCDRELRTEWYEIGADESTMTRDVVTNSVCLRCGGKGRIRGRGTYIVSTFPTLERASINEWHRVVGKDIRLVQWRASLMVFNHVKDYLDPLPRADDELLPYAFVQRIHENLGKKTRPQIMTTVCCGNDDLERAVCELTKEYAI